MSQRALLLDYACSGSNIVILEVMGTDEVSSLSPMLSSRPSVLMREKACSIMVLLVECGLEPSSKLFLMASLMRGSPKRTVLAAQVKHGG